MIKKDCGIAPPTKMVQRNKETGHLVSKSTSALSRGILKQRISKCTIHFQWRFYVPNSSLRKSSQYLRSSCELVLSIRLDRGKKGRVAILVDTKILTMVEPEEVELLAPPPTQAPGNRMQRSALNFQTLKKKVQLTQLCEKTLLPTSCDRRELLQISTK